MATIETGVFALLVILGSAFMLAAFRTGWPLSPFLRLISLGLFIGTAVILAAGTGVQTTQTISDGTTTWTQVTPVIPAGGSGTWLNYVFVGIGTLNLVYIVKEIWEG